MNNQKLIIICSIIAGVFASKGYYNLTNTPWCFNIQWYDLIDKALCPQYLFISYVFLMVISPIFIAITSALLTKNLLDWYDKRPIRHGVEQ